ncbi:hypothetical protein V2J09_012487 [Rumex salicifolius]
MNIMTWNCFGAGKLGFAKKVNYLIRAHSLKVLALFETRISGVQADKVCKDIKLPNCFRVDAVGFSGGIWIFWDEQVTPIRFLNTQNSFIRTRISYGRSSFQFIFVYGPPSVSRRRLFWTSLLTVLTSVSEPFLLGGDFNCIVSSEERQGGSGLLHNDSNIFKDLIHDLGLLDLGFAGSPFTWSRGRSAQNLISKRLDRILSDSQASILWPEATVRHLPKFSFDHTPLLLKLDPRAGPNRRRRPFRFEAVWLAHPSFHEFIHSAWPSHCDATQALSLLKPRLIQWNKESFGNIHQQKAAIIASMEQTQLLVNANPSDSLIDDLHRLQCELDDVLDQEDLHWKQKSRELWLKGGDRNTAFFHASTIVRRRYNSIISLQDESDVWLVNKEDIERHITSLFVNLYKLPPQEQWPINLPHGTECSFQLTDDLGSYLGLPLLHKRVNKHTFRPLLDKIEAKLSGWKSRHLSFAGRITLAKSVLSSLPVYSMGAFALPISYCRDIDRVSNAFIWGCTNERRRIHLVQWDSVCSGKLVGGLGLKKMLTQNMALIGKLGWRFLFQTDALWASVLRAKYIRPNSTSHNRPSFLWKSLSKGISNVVSLGSAWSLGNGQFIRFWLDRWLLDEPLFLSSGIPIDDTVRDLTVSSYWIHGHGWNWPLISHRLPVAILLRLSSVLVRCGEEFPDSLRWNASPDGDYSVRSAYSLLDVSSLSGSVDSVVFARIWKLGVPEKIRCFIWLVLRGVILTNAERKRRHMCPSDFCDCCPNQSESLIYLFRDCSKTSPIWNILRSPMNFSDFCSTDWACWLRSNLMWKDNANAAVAWADCFAVSLWWMWRWINNRVFQGDAFRGNAPGIIISLPFDGRACHHAEMAEFSRAIAESGEIPPNFEEISFWVESRTPMECESFYGGTMTSFGAEEVAKFKLKEATKKTPAMIKQCAMLVGVWVFTSLLKTDIDRT